MNLLNEFFSRILLEEYSEEQKAKMGIPRGAVASGGRWYDKSPKEGGNYLGKVVNKRFIQATEKEKQQDRIERGLQPTAQTKTKKPKSVKSVKKKSTLDKKVEIPTIIQTSMDQLPGKEGVLDAVRGITEKGSAGAGSKESRAAEASVVLTVNHLLTLRKNSDTDIKKFLREHDQVIQSVLEELSSIQGSKLKSDWLNATKRQVVATFSEIERKFGKIQQVVWDNQAGRDAIGLKKKNRRDRSDMYVVLDDGSIVGVSLKKSGKVFLANQGYASTIDDISSLSSDETSKQKLQQLKSLHREESLKKTAKLFKYVLENYTEVARELSQLTRDQIGKDVMSEKYDFLFDKSGKISEDFIKIFTSAAEQFTSGQTKGVLKAFTREVGFGEKRFKLLMKSLTTIAQSPSPSNVSGELATLLQERRSVDRLVTHKLVESIQTDPSIRKAITTYMLDVLDIPQTLTQKPFEGISNIVTVYGEGSVDEQGNDIPMFVDNEMLRKTLGISSDVSSKDIIKTLEERFIIDAEADSRVGFIRLRMTNPKPPPNYFYPTIASMAVRERGFGSSAVFELYQHDSWTATLLSGDPNPNNWSTSQRNKNAKETIKFLSNQLKNPIATDEQKNEIRKDLEFYKSILKGSK